jgi:hypothetical protein
MKTILDKITTIEKFADRIKWANANLKKIGKGSARYVYDLKNGYVLKLARNNKGIAQNFVESNKKLQKKYENIIAKIIDSDKDNKWVVQEKVIPLSNFSFDKGFELFEKIVKVSLNNYQSEVRFGFLDNKNPFVNQVKALMKEYKLDKFDVSDEKSLGILKDKIVLFDYGLDCETAQKLYKVTYNC